MCISVINQVTNNTLTVVVAHHVLQHAAEMPVQTSILIQQCYTTHKTLPLQTSYKLQTFATVFKQQTIVTVYQISFETKI